MHRKGAQDAKRARMFAKIAREIIVSARMGADPSANPRLRAAIAAARAANMPKDNVDRAIKKALGGEDTANYEEVRYEGYGPAGTALIVDTLTDNRYRTAPEIRSAFTKAGGNMGESGSVAFMFDRLGLIRLPKSVGSFDDVFEKAVEAGAENLEEDDDGYDVLTSVDDFAAVRDALTQSYTDIGESKLVWRPQNTIAVDEDAAQKIFKLIDTLEDNDDVQNVYCNFEVSDEIMAKLAG